MLCLNNDSKMQMRLNIKRHRQKLLQYLENTNDTVLKPKIKLVSNNLEKFNSNHNVKPKIAFSTELLNSKLEPTKIINHKTRSTVRLKQLKPIITTKEKKREVVTSVDIKKYKTRSSDTLNQLQPNIIVNVQAELPSSNIELKQKSISNSEIINPPEPIIKKLKEQLIEELYNSSSESEDIDDNISVGSNEDWSEIFPTDNKSDVYNNVSSNSIPVEAVKYYEQEQLVNEKSKEEYSYSSCDSDIPDLEVNYPNTRKKNRTRKMAKSQHKSNNSKQRFRKPQDRSLHNAKERACREQIAKKFDILRKSCSYLNTNRRVPSKHSILLAAKKECDLLKHFENKLIAEKKVWRKANDLLRERIANINNKNYKADIVDLDLN
ncbi:uncharacterized protein LOC132929653 [Rhopalosiphum padi]|uniref:uncharacterized protein LOC132929653 n=1 Tax=Rhopalosiphum padi TaxID=40932 RepID=UPI00298ECF91|nr:uncharacterized protein LOC132929653 [Rhopalosiphum padi]XP_060851141.1 uncharacterized protein LOC132929653 [Rhopalosiphum padi]XP_060851142.1 uncharacterized protein LOC132929653 [Rhopalosiphum padi]